MKLQRSPFYAIFVSLVVLLTACTGNNDPADPNSVAGGCAPNAVNISIIYAPESEQYMPQVMADFNTAYREGRHPVTGASLTGNDVRICITGEDGSSGTVMQGIVNAIIAPNNQNVARPTIFEPSVSHWLALANYQSGRTLFDLNNIRATALAPVVMAIWESRLEAIRQTVGYEDIGWEELLGVLNSPNGWCDYGIPNCRRAVYYGHTDPLVSSTALSTLIAEFYASADQAGYDGRLTLQMVRDEDVQDGVRDIEELIRHYSARTTEFKEYIAQGPEYLDFVALEENDLIYINRGLTEYQPPEQLVALYPKEGTFWHEHPMGIVQADWTTQEQRQAAAIFIDYVLTEPVQRIIMEQGFRPANPDVALGFPFVEENGIDPNQPSRVLDVPSADVIAAVQQNWSFVKKQADIVLMIDVSGSMQNEDKIGQAQEAALAFLNAMESTNRIELVEFGSTIQTRVQLGNVESNASRVRQFLNNLRAEGGTELYAAVTQVVSTLNESTDDNRIRAVVLLSDGADTGSMGYTLADAIQAIEDSRDSLNPVIFIPVAYGSDADVNALNAMARASNTRVNSGNAANILDILELISSYF